MLTILLAFYVIVAVSLFTLGLVVLLKNSKLLLHKLFFAFTTTLGLWILSNYFSNDFSLPKSLALVANHLALFFSGLALVVLFRFTVTIAQNQFFQKHKNLWYVGYAAVALSLTPLTILSIERQESVYAIEFGPLAPIYFAALAGSAVGAFVVLVMGMSRTKGEQKNQILAIFYSLIIAIGINMVTNLVIPVLTGSFIWTNLGPVATVVMVAGLSYSIVKHRLFDIRLVVARSLAYLFAIGTIVIFYGFLVFLASQIFFENQEISLARQTFYVVMSIFAALVAAPLKRYFDKLTNRLFYRDAYDTQAFLDQLNKVLVSNLDLEVLLTSCSRIIAHNMKPTYALFGLKETAYSPQRIIGTEEKKFAQDDIELVRSITPHLHRTIIVTDDLEEDSDLKHILRKYDISVVARLATDAEMEIEGLGYLLLGPKKSGNPYSRQDMKVIEIIANELVIAIQNALRFEEIQKFNVTLQEKIDDATKKLRKTNEKLKAMDETKDEFISMASHQLRTPLTSVKGYLSMVLEGDTGDVPEMQRKMLDQAFVSSQRMVYLIADLLNVSRLRTGKFIIEQQPTNLADVIEEEVNQLQETAKARNLTLHYDKPDNFPVLPMDETKIRQVCMNFLDNAIYYTPSGGEINVELSDDGKVIEYRVKDNGIGISKWEQAHLFTKFFRAGNAKKARPDGTGLGLFMAKKVIVASGGSIIFHSTEGKGSTFGFSFEKAKLEKMAAEQAQKEEVTHPKPTELAKK